MPMGIGKGRIWFYTLKNKNAMLSDRIKVGDKCSPNSTNNIYMG